MSTATLTLEPTESHRPTHVVELTPPGRGAVAVLLVAGPQAERAVAECFHPVVRRPLRELPLNRVALGRWGGPEGEELIACRRSPEQIEIHCHGGVAAVGAVIQELVDRGCRHIAWQDWLRQTSRDRLRTAAQIALAEAPTARTAAILLDQFHGALCDAVQQLAASIAAGDWPQAADTLNTLQRYRGVGLHLTTPWRVVLAGPTNVGKSSLINSLAGFERAIVSQQPGTTRDVVTTLTAIDGWPVELADTAGLRDSADALETAGIELATARIATADMVVVVHDAREQVASGESDTKPLEAIASRLPAATRRLSVWNKIDLVAAADRRGLAEAGDVLASALTGEGISELVARIGRALVPTPPPAGAAVPFLEEQFTALDAAGDAVGHCDATAAIAALQPLLAP